MTGDLEYLRTRAWPVLFGVAEWIRSRMTRSDRGYEIRASMGIAERETESENAVFTNMLAAMVLRDAVQTAERLGYAADPDWARIADRMVYPCASASSSRMTASAQTKRSAERPIR